MSGSSSRTVSIVATAKVKAEKKVYSLPGQRYETPEEREPLRIFYESLSKQKPESEIAECWYGNILVFKKTKRNISEPHTETQTIKKLVLMRPTKFSKKSGRLMEHGMLSPERAKRAYGKKHKRQKQQRRGTPIKAEISKENSESSKKTVGKKYTDLKGKKRNLDYDDDDVKPKKKKQK